MNNKHVEWCRVRVIIDNSTSDLFHMVAPNNDAAQEPEFRVTRATMDLVPQDFERYRPSLERMAEHWREEKQREMKKRLPTDGNTAITQSTHQAEATEKALFTKHQITD